VRHLIHAKPAEVAANRFVTNARYSVERPTLRRLRFTFIDQFSGVGDLLGCELHFYAIIGNSVDFLRVRNLILAQASSVNLPKRCRLGPKSAAGENSE
jgi:hypothetical protein